MSAYAVRHVDDIPERDDGRFPMRSVREHLGIRGFGVNAWVAREAGVQLVPEHQEANETERESDRDEELYLVVQGRAVFELDGEPQPRPAVLQRRLLREPHRHTAEALEHLRRAIELADQFRDSARNDPDLDPIRTELAFQELVAGADG